MSKLITCSTRLLPEERHNEAAIAAINENPLNRPNVPGVARLTGHLDAGSIAMVTSKYWRTNGVHLTVGFLETIDPDLRDRIILHMNAWSQTANVQFVYSATDPQVRISREGAGYWSYIGTDILLVDAGQPTMNLQGFTMDTPESEFHRVVRHETGHTLGCPHEHMRSELIALIDPAKAIAYFGATQGWSEQQVRAQVLTPLDQASIMGTPPDQTSIMCYHIPGELTFDGKPILGGPDIDANDYAFMGKVYAKPAPSSAPLDPSSVPRSLAAAHTQGVDRRCSVEIELPGGASLRIQREMTLTEIERLAHALRI